jgi:hypothetical protein
VSFCDAAEAESEPGSTPSRGRRAGMWFILPQGVSRLSSFYIFAVLAHRVDAGHLGAMALATAFASGAFALAPAIVGKPLAVATDPEDRLKLAPLSHSAAVLCSVAMAMCLVPAALFTHGLVRLAFISGVVGIPTVMIVESTYWRSVFVDGPRASGLTYSAAYAVQAAIVTGAAFVLSPGPLVVVSFAALGLPALVLLLRTRDLTPTRAWQWLTAYRRLWWPYVVGVSAAVALVQAIPAVLGATAGLEAASTYRAGELAFGGTNLLIGVSTQSLLTQSTTKPRQVYIRVSSALLIIAALNGLVIGLVPSTFLETFIGPTTPLLLGVLLIVTVQRAALAVSSVAAILLVPLISPRRFGLVDVVSAVTSMSLLVLGALLHGLAGGLTGLAVAEVFLAVLCGRLLRTST